jgi:flagellar motor switch protein FliN
MRAVASGGRVFQQEKNVATLDKVAVDITVVGTTSMPIHQVLRLGRGAIIELDAMEEDAVSILANNLPVAKGTVGRERQPHCRQRGRIASPASRYPVNGRP